MKRFLDSMVAASHARRRRGARRCLLAILGMSLWGSAGCDDGVSDIVFGSLQLAAGIVEAASD